MAAKLKYHKIAIEEEANCKMIRKEIQMELAVIDNLRQIISINKDNYNILLTKFDIHLMYMEDIREQLRCKTILYNEINKEYEKYKLDMNIIIEKGFTIVKEKEFKSLQRSISTVSSTADRYYRQLQQCREEITKLNEIIDSLKFKIQMLAK